MFQRIQFRSFVVRCVVAALGVGALVATVPRCAKAEDSAQARRDRCAAALRDAARPTDNFTPVTLRVLMPSIEPVPTTDGLINLSYVAQVTNTGGPEGANLRPIRREPADILEVVAVDPLADFAATGRNVQVDGEGNDVAGKVMRFGSSSNAPGTVSFITRLPAESGGLMLFDITYSDPTQVPRLLAHAVTIAIPVGSPSILALTDPVPVGCVPLAVVHPPLVGHGWTAIGGCCTAAMYHRDSIQPVNGDLKPAEHFAIDFMQLGPNNSARNGPFEALSSWWGYGTPVLAVAPGVVAEVVDGMPDQTPVGTVTDAQTPTTAAGNHVIEDIGAGRYVFYAHLKPGSIPARVRKGAVLRPGELIGRLGNSGNSTAPHMHFQLMNHPSDLNATGLPFVFDTQLLEGRLTEDQAGTVPGGETITTPIDRTGAGVKRDLMPTRNDVSGYNLSR